MEGKKDGGVSRTKKKTQSKHPVSRKPVGPEKGRARGKRFSQGENLHGNTETVLQPSWGKKEKKSGHKT